MCGCGLDNACEEDGAESSGARPVGRVPCSLRRSVRAAEFSEADAVHDGGGVDARCEQTDGICAEEVECEQRKGVWFSDGCVGALDHSAAWLRSLDFGRVPSQSTSLTGCFSLQHVRSDEFHCLQRLAGNRAFVRSGGIIMGC